MSENELIREMLAALKSTNLLFSTALLSTNVEIAKEGMAFVNENRLLIAKATAHLEKEG